jgi:gamma-glutamyl:cysteine ligase YbdK (ATP-grasp superfamily)
VSDSLEFKPSPAFTVGTELELQILNSRDFDLARDAADLIGLIDKADHPGRSSRRSPRAWSS